jgi:hypothetical protein
MKGELHLDILPSEQIKLFRVLSVQSFIKDFYLAGGTCLALQIGHRRSVDFDFFIPSDFDTEKIVNILVEIGTYKRTNEERNTINGILNDVRISFLGYKYKNIDSFIQRNNIFLAGLKDIAAMKMEAIASRGSRKDFVDIYFLLKQFSLDEVLDFHHEKYGDHLSNRYHLLKSLVYFADADAEAMPLMVKPLPWSSVRDSITKRVRKYKM